MKQEKLKKIANSRLFINMPVTSQALYFHLFLRADDNGFVDEPLRIKRILDFCENDFWYLFRNGFISIYDNKIKIEEVSYE
nr:MAG TPA: hypothetical protein [Caudoviricetes sp.]